MQTYINHTLWPFNHIISWKNFQGNDTDKYQTYIRHIPLVHPYQKDFTKELQNLGNNADTFTRYIRYDYSGD